MSPSEEKVINLLYRENVSTLAFIKDQLGICRMTALRGLKKHGYYSSCNFNSRYLTLQDIPRFDSNGLWYYDDICFSRHVTLRRTISALIEDSPAGRTLHELEELLNSKAHNHVGFLKKSGDVSGFYYGRNVVYVSSKATRSEKQMDARVGRSPGFTEPDVKSSARLPAGFNPLEVISVLIEMIKHPRHEAEQISKTLANGNSVLTAARVRMIVDFYSLQKKRER